MNIKRIYLNQNPTIDLKFVQNKDDFIVDEVQNFKKSSRGRYAIVRVKKVYMTTWEMVQTISSQLRIDEKQIGYAGLKDKSATTTQYISFPAVYATSINNLKHRSIEVLELFYSDFPIQRGKLLGNRFTINLKDIKPQDLPVIYQNISHIQKHGVPNYFGYQRFGIDNKFEQSQKVACGEEIIKDKKLEHMLVSIYQSYLFNAWLAKRVALSLKEDSKKLLPIDGDVYDKETRSIITGLMPGANIVRAKDKAREIEKEFDDMSVTDFKGYRRDAWIFPQEIENKYNKETNSIQIKFTLPPSSYATVVIENLINENLEAKII